MSAYWTFGKKGCEVFIVGPLKWNGIRSHAEDEKGEIYEAGRLFDTKIEALKAANAYLDRKQAEIDERQAQINRRRKIIQNQTRQHV